MSESNRVFDTKDKYLRVEADTSTRHEYLNGEMVEMPQESTNHEQICQNIRRELSEIVENMRCDVIADSTKLEVESANSFLYPDAMVICGRIDFRVNRKDVVRNPVLVIEVLSENSEAYDRGDKFRQYRLLPSVREYILISQERATVETFVKKDSDLWEIKTTEGLYETIELNALQGNDLPLKQIYKDVIW